MQLVEQRYDDLGSNSTAQMSRILKGSFLLNDQILAKRELFQDTSSMIDEESKNKDSFEMDGDQHEDSNQMHYPNQIVLELNEEEKERIAQAAKEDGENVQDQLQEKQHEFDQELVEFNLKFEQSIENHINSNAFTDRKIIGSLLGMSVFGGVGFLVFSGAITFGISGGVLGIVLGGVIGSRIRRKVDLKKLTVDQYLSFKITQIIKWTNKNYKKLDQLWFAILVEKVSNKIELNQLVLDFDGNQDAPRICRQKTCLKNFTSVLYIFYLIQLQQKSHIPTIEEFIKFEEVDQKKTIYKTFNFYIPFLQFLKLSKAFKKYQSMNIYKKLVALVYSHELINSIIRVVEESKTDQRFGFSLDHESVIFLPDEYDILETFKQAVNHKDNEPFALLKKRVIQYICIEELVEEQRREELEKRRFTNDLNNSHQQQHRNQNHSMYKENNSYNDDLKNVETQQRFLIQPEIQKFPPQFSLIKESPIKADFNTYGKGYEGPHHLNQVMDKQLSLARGDQEGVDEENISFRQRSQRQSLLDKQLSDESTTNNASEEQKQNNKYRLEDGMDAPPQIVKSRSVEPLDQDFTNLMRVAVEDVTSWEKACTGENISVYKKMTEGSPIVLLKAFALIKGVDPLTVFEVMSNQEIRRQWDKVVCGFEIIEDDPQLNLSVIYYMIKTPIGISNRDFVQQRKIKLDFPNDGMITMHFKSVKCSKCPEKPRTIRAETIISGYILEKIKNKDGSVDTAITIISQNDIKGIVPKAIVNMVSGKAPKQWVQNLVKGCTDYLNGVYTK
ncbi:UNKNOWN [Stylonychia lemnae]|uniref:Phosphatidylcholine transfer protein n=1 Tax=Stylonychia lemnae TaxID=5949 RepID=A0A078BBI2_STYLE|nr:UNKNOWN [Stylonychia lemnae]|eukprot:CDW91759.1 UNKNOWN [Stylonychia lemnae]